MHDNILKLMQKMALFKTIDLDQLEKLAGIMYPARVSEGEVLFRQGIHATAFYVVVSGNFMISLESGEAFTLHKSGAFIGWATISAVSRYIATGTALTDGEVLVMYRNDFFSLIQQDAVLGDKLMRHHSRFLSEKMPYLMNR
ncbi:MAG: hypothetical protein CSA22_05500 [Deltaproteobacteria bacterium]|nr:MAG: hypothetical protein CSA22_05500 [Deltaproteobacteria bacterium]